MLVHIILSTTHLLLVDHARMSRAPNNKRASRWRKKPDKHEVKLRKVFINVTLNIIQWNYAWHRNVYKKGMKAINECLEEKVKTKICEVNSDLTRGIF